LQKESLAGVKAGAVSGALAGLIFAVFIIVEPMGRIESLLGANTMLLILVLIFVGMLSSAMGSCAGAIAGFIFVKAVNKLPFHSTYVKAVLPWVVLLILSTLPSTLFN
jgi:hypothetical protein